MGIRAGLAVGLCALFAAACTGRAISRDDAALLRRRPDIHPVLGQTAPAQLRYVAPAVRRDKEVARLAGALSRGLSRTAHLPELAERPWSRQPAPTLEGPLVDPADALAARLLEMLRARGLASPRTDACRHDTCEPDLLLQTVVERVELSVTDRPARPLLPQFIAAVTLVDTYRRVLWRGRCELTLSARLYARPPPMIPEAQGLLDKAALACASRLAEELSAAVEGRKPSAAPDPMPEW